MPAAVLVIFTLLLAFVWRVSAGDVEADLDRESVPAGQGALLSLRISGKANRPELPEVDNLIVNPRGQSQQIQLFNGSTSVTTTYSYAVGSLTPGEYVIPAFEVTVDGEKHKTRALTLKVVDSAAAKQAQEEEDAEQPEPDTGPKQFGFLTVEPADSERKHVYVGEIAPVRIQAWLPDGSRLNLRSTIKPEGQGFTLHNLSQRPQQDRQTRDGKPYIVLTWFGGISATKPGDLPASLSLDATVAVRDTSAPKRQRRRIGGPFDDPFFDRAFDRMNTPMIQKDVTLKSEDQEIEVRPLPTEGKPEGFTGAVGEFQFDAVETPDNWKTGEPQQIRVRLSGSGNFSLMKAPTLTPADSWKVYPGKDEFNSADETSFSGSKVFQFSAVPKKGGAQETALTFSYFDPTGGAYKTLKGGEKTLNISGEDVVEEKEKTVEEPPQPVKKPDELIPQKEQESPATTLVPLVSRFAFIEICITAAVMALAGWILGWIRMRKSDPRRKSAAAFEKARRDALDATGSAKDLSEFFAAARLAIQHQLGALWGQPPQAITTAEVSARVPADSPVARFFQEADRNEYFGKSSGTVPPEWRTLFEQALASITPTSR